MGCQFLQFGLYVNGIGWKVGEVEWIVFCVVFQVVVGFDFDNCVVEDFDVVVI